MRGMKVLCGLLAAACLALVVTLSAQAPAPGTSYTPARTPWGDPDLQGIWPGTDMVSVPFERPAQFGSRLFLTEEEFKAREAQAAKQAQLDVLEFDLEKPPAEIVALGDIGGVTSPPPHWLERGLPSRQSSLIVDPPDGKMPPFTPEGAARQKTAGGTYTKQTGFKSADELGPYDRCISRGVVGSMMPVVYNNGNQIIQAPGLVAFRNEMIHETRIIPLDGRPSLPTNMKSWMGTSRGRWDGNTLVVETKNLNGKTGMQGNGMMLIPSDSIEIVERFTPLSANILQYRGDDQRSEDLDETVEGLVPAAPRQLIPAVRVRVSRGQLRDAQHAVWVARRRESDQALSLRVQMDARGCLSPRRSYASPNCFAAGALGISANCRSGDDRRGARPDARAVAFWSVPAEAAPLRSWSVSAEAAPFRSALPFQGAAGADGSRVGNSAS